ncbi:MAG: riboflavin synthase [Bacteroidia bacterium]|nr:riboflavin synthase [Bacteroidia bacterium]
MFTGIVEAAGTVISATQNLSNIEFEIESVLSPELKIDQSLSHNGICLTVTKITGKHHFVTAISETIGRTDIASWKPGSKINLERCMPANGRFDGHIVQGHVDTKGICTKVTDDNGSKRFHFTYQSKDITVEKGSITVNGVSLTVVDSLPGEFSVAVIPYTLENTGFAQLKTGDYVNLEFDIIGKYIAALVKK